MQAYELQIIADMRIVVPDEFKATLMQDSESGEFPKLTAKRKQFVQDDAGFLMDQLELGVQNILRRSLPQLLERYGLGCSFVRTSMPERTIPTVAEEM